MEADAFDPAAMKRIAAAAIGTAAADALSELGGRRRGRSPRYWFVDHGWWRVNVWFEPSAYGVRINLRVGVQLLWSMHDRATIADSSRWGPDRVPDYPTGDLDGGPRTAENVASAYAREAAARVRRIQAEYSDDTQHLQALARVEYLTQADGGLEVPQGFVLRVDDVLLANSALGREEVCREVIDSHRRALLTDPNRTESWSRTDEQLTDLDTLAAIVRSAGARELIAARIDSGRALLGMAQLASRPDFLSAGSALDQLPGG